MTKANQKFSWRNARDDEIRFTLEHDASSSVQHDVESLNEQSDAPNLGMRGMQVLQPARNEINQNRILANDKLYLALYEHPGMILTTDLFDGKNFHTWSRSIKRALFARNKLSFIDGSMLEPRTNSIDHMQWIKADYLVFNWLCNSVVKELSRGLQNLNTSQELWDELNKRFGKRNGPRLYKLRREIASYSQCTQFVLVYFNNLSALWDELALLKTSMNYTCAAAADTKADLEEKHMMEFLMGLNDMYEQMRQQILIMNPLPTTSQTYSMVLQVEDQVHISSHFSENADQSALYSGHKPQFKKEGFVIFCNADTFMHI